LQRQNFAALTLLIGRGITMRRSAVGYGISMVPGFALGLALADCRRNDLRQPRLGFLLMMGRDLNDMSQVMAVMLLIMLLGVTVDRAVFHLLEKRIQRKWGLTPRE